MEQEGEIDKRGEAGEVRVTIRDRQRSLVTAARLPFLIARPVSRSRINSLPVEGRDECTDSSPKAAKEEVTHQVSVSEVEQESCGDNKRKKHLGELGCKMSSRRQSYSCATTGSVRIRGVWQDQ